MIATAPQLASRFQEGLALHQQGQFALASNVYLEILNLQPRHAAALHLLGVIAAQTGNPSRAVELIGRSLEIDAGNAGAYCNQGLAFQELENFPAALASYDKAIALNANFAEAHSNRGNVLREVGQLDAALASYDRAIALKPQMAEAHSNRGMVLRELGQPEAALESYERAIALKPDFARAYSNRGDVLRELNRLDAALASCNRAVDLDPGLADAHSNRAIVLRELKRWDAALANCNRAIALNAGLAEAHCNRGIILKEQNQFEAALASYDAAIALESDYADAYLNRANVLMELARFDAALASFDRAIALRPGDALAYAKRGTLFYHLNRLESALENYDQAIALDPSLAEGYFSRAIALLHLGDLERGSRDYEWRWKISNGSAVGKPRQLSRPLWLGGESLDGKTILLYHEQGLGDTIQYCRYATLAAELGARVVLEVQRPLVSILASLSGVAQIKVAGELPPDFDYHCPLMSLPLAFKTSLATVPSAVPYLQPDAERRGIWREKLGPRTKPRIGLVWSGGFRPDQPEIWSVNARRNIPLTKLAALANSGIEFYSLQKGEPAESELASCVANGWGGPQMIDLTAELDDFADTAALIENLDLVISVDTSTAHLAGALGKPVWLLNRFDSCWRWLRDRADSPWYPTLKIYRQQSPGDWDPVVESVKADLAELLLA